MYQTELDFSKLEMDYLNTEALFLALAVGTNSCPLILNIIELNPPLSLGVVLDLLNLGPLLLLSLYFISGGRDVNWGHVLNSYLCRFSQPHLFFSPRFGSRRVKKMGCGATRVSPEHHWRPPAPKVLAVPAKQGSQRVISRHGVVRQEMVRGSQPCVAPVCDFTSLGEAKLQMDLLGSAWVKVGHRTEDVAQSSALGIESDVKT